MRFLLVALLLASVGAGIDAAVRSYVAETSEPARGAAWIWAEGVHRSKEPIAFWAVRDVELSKHKKAWITIAASESYVLRLNGRRVGSRVRRGDVGPVPVDRYDVSRFSRVGVNRIAVELRSASGAGGLLATMRIEEPENVFLRTDASWSIFRTEPEGVYTRDPLPEDVVGEAPQIWRRAPTGRWRLGDLVDRPILQRDLREPREARRVRFPAPDARWLKVSWRKYSVPAEAQLIYDFGKRVCGLLTFDVAETSAPAGLLDIGIDEVPLDVRPPADGLILPIPGSGFWQDPQPRCLRYARLRGVLPASVPHMVLFPNRKVDALHRDDEPLGGVFTLQPPQAETPEEDALRRRLDLRERELFEAKKQSKSRSSALDEEKP